MLRELKRPKALGGAECEASVELARGCFLADAAAREATARTGFRLLRNGKEPQQIINERRWGQ